MSIISKLSDAKLRHEANRLEKVNAEIARRADEREHAEETAQAEALAKLNAAKILDYRALVGRTEQDIEETRVKLENALLALSGRRSRSQPSRASRRPPSRRPSASGPLSGWSLESPSRIDRF